MSTDLMAVSYTHLDVYKRQGNASRENILEDALRLELDVNVINDFLVEEDEAEDDDDDDELFSIINAKRG